jgi:hypothetical protein
VWLLTLGQPELRTSVRVFSALSCGAWLFVLWWGWQRRHDPHQWHHIWLLAIGTVFWWLGESVAIRLGKYEYDQFFPLRIPLLAGGFHDPDAMGRLLAKFPSAVRNPIEGCHADVWAIPFPVVAFEAVVLFSMLRIAHLRLRGRGWRVALPTAGLSGLLLIGLTAVLDPVVSKTNECGTQTQLGTAAVALWTWFTTDLHQGYWFGVPLINYVAWFTAALVFSLMVRLDDEGPGGIVRQYDSILKYVGAALLFMLILFAVLLPLKFGIDYVFRARPEAVDQKVWQFGVLAVTILGLGAVPVLFARLQRRLRFDWISIVPLVTTLLLSFVALTLRWNVLIFVVWIVSSLFVSAVMFWPRLSASTNAVEGVTAAVAPQARDERTPADRL